ncbi:MAG: histidine--tRNA ligase [Dehalococcoidia bacterium]|nr:histidine--tRNA ligase [Dehalococcoidia bacterium]
MAALRAPRGMHDLLPDDEALFEHVVDTATRVARSFDYHLIRTPIVEDVGVFLRSVGDESDIVSKEMYVFEDRGGDQLALRPEGTAGVARAYLEHGMASRPQPVRLFYWGPFFRYDRPQAGRYRQLHQFGVECIGDPSPAADVEVIELQREIYRALGLGDLVLRINAIGTAATRRNYEAALREHFRPHLATLSGDSQRRFETNVLRILDSKEDVDHAAVKSATSILDSLAGEDREHWDTVRALLDRRGIDYEVDPRIVRGLDYYAHTVWEFEPADAGGQSTVGAGGRYDGLIETLGGPNTPGVGWATGLERIMLLLRERGIDGVITARALDAVTVPLGEAGAGAAVRLASILRADGFAVRGGTPGRSMRAALRAADASGARFALIIGDREAAEGVVQVKPLLGEGEQITVPLAEVAMRLRG